jgi:hypothetical protein
MSYKFRTVPCRRDERLNQLDAAPWPGFRFMPESGKTGRGTGTDVQKSGINRNRPPESSSFWRAILYSFIYISVGEVLSAFFLLTLSYS